IKVLMIEDSKLIASNMKEVLEHSQAGLEVSWAETLAQGLEHLAVKPTDVVLLDLMLPDSDGFETFLKTSVLVPKIPIVVMTGVDDETFAINAVRHGAQDYLVKGKVDGPVMVRTIRYAIERKRIEEDLRKARTELEYRVQERTAELRDINENLQKEIEERKKTEEELKAAYGQLKVTQAQLIYSEKMDTVGRLASGVAHEVKNPLAILVQCVEYLRRSVGSRNEKVDMTLKFMGEAVIRADNIIKGLLDFSSISKLELVDHQPEHIVDNSLLFMKHEFDKHRVQVRKEYAPNIPKIKIDKNRVEQIFLNIFMNAVDAMAEGGILNIRISGCVLDHIGDGVGRRGEDLFRINDPVVVIEVEDSGPGIPAAMLNKIFDPFFTTKHDKGGTGLGLPIIKNIMEMHNGRIAIKNREQGGVNVTLTFRA
ncbi:MAG: ATP-binding protein, partial [Candidatus Omnitrophota bacterium]